MQNITLTATGINIDGRYFTVVNGYQSSKRGQFHIEYKSLLAVNLIRRWSKKLMFLFILVGSGLAFALPLVRSGFRLVGADTVFGAFGIAVGFVAVCLLAFFFSCRAYVEFTFIGGVIRVPCKMFGNDDTKQLVEEIRTQKERYKRA
jgi:hypothetical protein